MKRSVRLNDLRSMSDEERGRVLRQLAVDAQSPPNGELEAINAEITDYERRYEVSSDRMRAELAAGTRRETAEIASWLITLHVRDMVAARQARA